MKIVVRPSPKSDFARYQRGLEDFLQFRQDTFSAAGRLHSGNIGTIAKRVRIKEVRLAKKLGRAFDNVPQDPRNPGFPICQTGEICVPMSLSNSLFLLEPSDYYGQTRSDQIAATNHFIDHFLATEPGHDRSERRSLDRVVHYFQNGLQKQVGLEQNYRFELTGSLIKMLYALHSQTGTVLSVFRAHCQMAYGLFRHNDLSYLEMKDPLIVQNKALAIDQFADHFAWSALAGLPHACAHGASFDANSAAQFIRDQEQRNNTGILCSSGILWRVPRSVTRTKYPQRPNQVSGKFC